MKFDIRYKQIMEELELNEAKTKKTEKIRKLRKEIFDKRDGLMKRLAK